MLRAGPLTAATLRQDIAASEAHARLTTRAKACSEPAQHRRAHPGPSTPFSLVAESASKGPTPCKIKNRIQNPLSSAACGRRLTQHDSAAGRGQPREARHHRLGLATRGGRCARALGELQPLVLRLAHGGDAWPPSPIQQLQRHERRQHCHKHWCAVADKLSREG